MAIPTWTRRRYRLKVTGLVNQTKSFSLDELKKMGGKELVAGFECSGNRGPLQSLCGNGRWTGLPLKAVLDAAGVKTSAKEFVFFGADHGQEEIEWRTQKFTLEQNFGRSLPREKALSSEPFLAYALNGEPLTKHQGAPLRLLVPGYYGVCNVKWLSHIHLQEDAVPRPVPGALVPHAARRDDRRRDDVEGNLGHPHEPEVVHRARHQDRRPVQGVGGRAERRHANQVRRSEGRRRSVADGRAGSVDKEKYGWKLFTYDWTGVTPGDHTLVSRVTDVNGRVQRTAQENETKKSFLEEDSQAPRKVKVA